VAIVANVCQNLLLSLLAKEFLKIGQRLTKLEPKYSGLFYSGHGVEILNKTSRTSNTSIIALSQYFSCNNTFK